MIENCVSWLSIGAKINFVRKNMDRADERFPSAYRKTAIENCGFDPLIGAKTTAGDNNRLLLRSKEGVDHNYSRFICGPRFGRSQNSFIGIFIQRHYRALGWMYATIVLVRPITILLAIQFWISCDVGSTGTENRGSSGNTGCLLKNK